MQNLANNTQFGGLKEFYMSPLNEFLTNVREKLNKFLEDITKVDTLDDQVQLDKYLRLGKTQQENYIHISLNEMYFIHGLVREHVSSLCTKADSKVMQEVITELGPSPPQLPKKDNHDVDLLLIPRTALNGGNSDSTDQEAEIDPQAPEHLFLETKYLLFTLLRSLPQMNFAVPQSDDLNKLLDLAKKVPFSFLQY